MLLSHLLTYSEEKSVLQNDIITKLNDIATLQHKRIHQLLESKKESVNLIASRTQLRLLTQQYQNNHSVESLKKISKILNDAKQSASSINNLTIFSLQQDILASTGLAEQRIQQHIFHNTTKEGDQSLNIQIFRDKNDQLIIDFVQQLYINGKHIGYISAEFSNTELINILSDYTGLGQTGEMVLAGRDNKGNAQFLTPTRHNKNSAFTITIPKSRVDIPITFAMKGKSTTLQNYVDYRSVPVLAISRHIHEVDWGMIIKIDMEEAFEPLGYLQTLMTELLIIITLLAIVISLFIGNKLSKPISALEQVVLGIVKGDTSLRAKNSKLIEINRLGNALNIMVVGQLGAETLLHDSIKKLTDINEKIHSESQRFKRWKESNFIGIIHSDANGSIIDANSALLNMIGYEEADLLSGAIDWQKLTPKEFLHLDIAAIQEAEERGFWTPFEKEYLHKNGRRVPILIGGSIYKYDTKEFIVFIIDLTDRNQQLDALGKYKRIFENSNDLIAYIDSDYQFKIVNDVYAKYHGLSKENIENHSITKVLGKEFLHEQVKESIDKTLSGSVIKFFETFNFKGVGEKLINVTYTPYKNDNGKVVGFIFRGEDVTELEEQRQEIQLTKREQEQIINSMLEGVLTTDSKGVILTFNPEAENIFGYNQGEIIGKNVSLLMPSKHASMHDHYLIDFANGKHSTMVDNRQGRSVTALHKDKHEFPLRISIAQLPKNKLNRVNFIANFQDLTEIERQKEMANRSLRMESLGSVTGGIAHDFNNILGIITGYCSLLLEKPSSEKDHRYLSAIEAASNRGAALTKNLLTFSKNQSTAITLVSINDIMLANMDMIETLLTSKISLDLRLEQPLCLTYIDQNLFEDLLLNMSINAMHAMPDGGKLELKTENIILSNDDKFDMPFQPGQYVKVSIEDSGCGMSKEVSSKIFEPFYTTKGNIGNGLGLSQCYGFVTSSNGVITVNSEQNKGSIFSIYLPASIKGLAIEQLPNTKKVDEESFEPANYTIIIVDDENQILELNTEMLEDVGFNVFSFSNAEDALTLLANRHIDMVITDVVMPTMGGVEFISKAKKIVPALKYLFVSGYLDDKSAVKGQEISPLLNKPYTRNELITSVQTLCGGGTIKEDLPKTS
jgi:PAS domain S-box-containing protein